MKILIAEDDKLSRVKLEFTLEGWGWTVISTSDGAEAYAALSEERDRPSIAILDVMMPRLTGIEVCRRVRQKAYPIPPYILLLTAKNDKEDVVVGLEAGANDYVTKPFDAAELRARLGVGLQMLELQQKLTNKIEDLEASLSRISQLQGLLRKDAHKYDFGVFRLEPSERRLLCRGQVVPLPEKAFQLLLLLVQNSGYLIEKNEIMKELWPDTVVEENNLTVHISALRKALAENRDSPQYIETVSKRGYRFISKVTEL